MRALALLTLSLLGLPRAAASSPSAVKPEPSSANSWPTAESDEDAEATRPLSQESLEKVGKSRLLATGVAIVPGALVHGAGHFVRGDTETAGELFVLEGVGLALFLGGGVTLFATGASRYLVAPAAALTMGGFGLFSTSYLADVYGVAASEPGAARSRLRAPARFETELGYRRIEDAQFAYSDFLIERISRTIGPFRLTPSAWFAVDGKAARYRFEGAYRFIGAEAGERVSDGSWCEVRLGLTRQKYVADRFTQTVAEVSLDARYDFGRLAPSLHGAFAELGTGYGLGRIDYDARGVSVPSDFEHLLLGRIAFGVVLRGLSAPGSEASVYYDHRHDDYAAGLKLTGIGSGVAGHFGADFRWYFNETWGAGLGAEVGSAYLGGASLLFRQGVLP